MSSDARQKPSVPQPAKPITPPSKTYSNDVGPTPTYRIPPPPPKK